jgi:Derlin-2/3
VAKKETFAFAMSYTGFWDEIRKIPPVTRFLCGSSLAVSIPVMLQLLNPYKVVFVRQLVIQRFEVRPSFSMAKVLSASDIL